MMEIRFEHNTSADFRAMMVGDHLYKIMANEFAVGSIFELLVDIFAIRGYLDAGVKVLYWNYGVFNTNLSQHPLSAETQYKITFDYAKPSAKIEKY